MYARTNSCYNERGSRNNYVRSSIPTVYIYICVCVCVRARARMYVCMYVCVCLFVVPFSVCVMEQEVQKKVTPI